MKVRIKGNTLRIRIQQQELLDLAKNGKLEDGISFGPTSAQRLDFILIQSPETDTVTARLDKNRISVLISANVISEMVDTDRVGVQSEQVIDEHTALHLLVEKDFKCLTPRQEDADAFPHPQQEHGHTC